VLRWCIDRGRRWLGKDLICRPSVQKDRRIWTDGGRLVDEAKIKKFEKIEKKNSEKSVNIFLLKEEK
jgi:DNA mismatch repair protein MutH